MLLKCLVFALFAPFIYFCVDYILNLLYVKWYIYKHQAEYKPYIQEYLGKNITFTELQDLIQHVSPIVVSADLKAVLKQMEQENVWLLPVVDPYGAYMGMVSKTSIFNKYRDLLNQQADYLS